MSDAPAPHDLLGQLLALLERERAPVAPGEVPEWARGRMIHPASFRNGMVTPRPQPEPSEAWKRHLGPILKRPRVR